MRLAARRGREILAIARLVKVVGRGVPTAPRSICRTGAGAVGTPRPTSRYDSGPFSRDNQVTNLLIL